MKKVLITGAGGFIGRHTLPFLQGKNYEVHAVSSGNQFTSDAIWHRANLLNLEETASLLERVRPTQLLHFAWITTPKIYWSSLQNLSWIEASLHLAERFAAYGGERMVVAGSCAEYTPGPRCHEIKTPFIPTTLYGQSKRNLYLLLEALANQKKLSFAWGYLFHLFGPHEQQDRFLPSVIQGLLQKKTIPCSHGEQIRDFLHVQDAAEAFVKLLDTPLVGAINIGSGQEISLRELAEKAAQKIGGTNLLQFGAVSTSNDPPHLTADISRQREKLQWRPKESLDSRLDQVIQWWSEQ